MFKIEPLTSLAMSIHANPGVYALLVGSGVSRAASIPTGWGITLDLIDRLAAARGEQTGGDPVAWFKRTYDADPDYSDLLDQLYDQGSRHAKLREYFEPNDQEREEGRKLPTLAHKAIARLVRGGFVRVLITTNFDHLLEDALRNEGIEPVLVSTPDAINGATPLVHTKCFIVKVHGDYLDVRIKNTRKELETYDTRIDQLLDQILDGFGLIVCGWSAEWDPALRAAIERCPNRRYAIFWTALDEPGDAARKLIELRAAKLVRIESADRFFDDLAEKIASLAEAATPNPADVQMAIALAKRYLPDERHRIRLHDLILAEARESQSRLIDIEGTFQGGGLNMEAEAQKRETACEKLLQLLAICGFHARGDQRTLLRGGAEVIAASLYPTQGGRPLHPLLLYSSAMAIYATSLAAIAAAQEATAAEMLMARADVWHGIQGRVLPLLARSDFNFGEMAQPNGQRIYAPISQFIFDRCKRFVVSLFVDAGAFELAYDRFEYIQALIAWDERDRNAASQFYYGRWMWKASWSTLRGLPDMRQIVASEIERAGNSWAYLQPNLFNGSLERLRTVKQSLDEHLQPVIERMQHGF
jgi:SIR2-like protein